MSELLEYADLADECHIRLCELADNDRTKWTPQYWRNLEGHKQAIEDSVCGLPTINGHVCDLPATAHTQHRQLNDHGGAIWWDDYATKDQSYPERRRADNWTADDTATDLDPSKIIRESISTMFVDSVLPRLRELELINQETYDAYKAGACGEPLPNGQPCERPWAHSGICSTR